jgi:aspartyl-tRNA(Asn)/glutamyl-tRNA(Gln) amidotransferase subunit A
MQIDDWLTSACADADRRRVAGMRPLLEPLARSTAALREMDRLVRAQRDLHDSLETPASDDGRRPAMIAPDLRCISEVAPLIKSGTVSPVDLVRAALARIDARPDLNAFITVMRETALAEAQRCEHDIAAGRYRGPLHGVPVSVKDLIDVAGTPTTGASAVPPRRPREDAPLVARLRKAGAILVGKTNLHEFAFGTTCDESAFGPVRHPQDPSRSAGGSSGGAAVALLEGMCFASVGTDTGGSIRIPSAACGIVGLKATVDELPCAGVFPLSATLDHVGPMARSVRDVTTLFHAMKGDRDSERGPAGPPQRRRFGIPEAYFCERLHPDVRRALTGVRGMLIEAGHDVRPVHIEHAVRTPDVYLHIVLPEASWIHSWMLDAHADRYSPGVRLRLEMGRYIMAEDYVRARFLQRVMTEAVERAMNGCDALLLPTLAIPAPPLGAATVEVDGGSEPVRAIMLRLTQLFNITGHPAIALPAGRTQDGWPVSVPLVGLRDRTGELLELAASLEGYMIGGDGSVGGGTG